MKNKQAQSLLSQLKTIIKADSSWKEEAKEVVNEALDMGIEALKQNDHIKEDCYFYTEDHDMGATIPLCTYRDKWDYLDDKPYKCENCNKFISGSTLNQVFRDIALEHIARKNLKKS